MQGVLKISIQFLTHATPELDVLVKRFIRLGKVDNIRNDTIYKYITFVDHPHFDNPDPKTVYMLYMGNRLNRLTGNMEARILHLDRLGKQGRLIPVRYYNDNHEACGEVERVEEHSR